MHLLDGLHEDSGRRAVVRRATNSMIIVPFVVKGSDIIADYKQMVGAVNSRPSCPSSHKQLWCCCRLVGSRLPALAQASYAWNFLRFIVVPSCIFRQSPRSLLRSTAARKATSWRSEVMCATCPDVMCSMRPATRRGGWAHASRCRTNARSGGNSNAAGFALVRCADEDVLRSRSMHTKIRRAADIDDGTDVRLRLEDG